MQIFAVKNCNGALNRPPRILHLENANSALKKWKFHAPKMEIPCSENGNSMLRKWKSHAQKMEIPCSENRNSPHTVESRLFHTKSGKFVLLRSSQNSALNSTIAES